jgi:hypothetical protein
MCSGIKKDCGDRMRKNQMSLGAGSQRGKRLDFISLPLCLSLCLLTYPLLPPKVPHLLPIE